MEIIKHKLLGIVDNENEIAYNENPFVRKINSDNSVKYFNGLWMKVWTSGKTHLQTLKVSDSYTLSYVRGQKDIETGEDASRVLNYVFSGDIDDGYIGFKYPDVYIEQIREAIGDEAAEIIANTVVYAKENDDSTITIKNQNPQTGEWQSDSAPIYSETGQTTHINYEIYKIVPPKQGYINVFTTLENTEGKKFLVHDNYFIFDTPTAKSAVTKVVFSKEVNEIPVFAFGMLASLQEVALPDKLKKIPINAFTNCYRLYNVTIPSTVEYVGKYSFNQCFSLSSITLPGNVTYIGDDCFYGCSGLTDIYFDGYKDNCPYGSPWGATNAVIRFKDGYLQGGKLVLTNGIEGDSGQTVNTLYRVEMFDQTVDGVKYYAFSTGEPLFLGISGTTNPFMGVNNETGTDYRSIGNYMMALSEFKQNDTIMKLFYIKDIDVKGEVGITLYYGLLEYDNVNKAFYLTFNNNNNIAYDNVYGQFKCLEKGGDLRLTYNHKTEYLCILSDIKYKYYPIFNQEVDGVIYHAYAYDSTFNWDNKTVTYDNLVSFIANINSKNSDSLTNFVGLYYVKDTTTGVHVKDVVYTGEIKLNDSDNTYQFGISSEGGSYFEEIPTSALTFVDKYFYVEMSDKLYHHPLFDREVDGITWYWYFPFNITESELEVQSINDTFLLNFLTKYGDEWEGIISLHGYCVSANTDGVYYSDNVYDCGITYYTPGWVDNEEGFVYYDNAGINSTGYKIYNGQLSKLWVGEYYEQLNTTKDNKTYSAYTAIDLDVNHHYTFDYNQKEYIQSNEIIGEWRKDNICSIWASAQNSPNYDKWVTPGGDLKIYYFSSLEGKNDYLSIGVGYLVVTSASGPNLTNQDITNGNINYTCGFQEPKLMKHIENYVIDRNVDVNSKLLNFQSQSDEPVYQEEI